MTDNDLRKPVRVTGLEYRYRVNEHSASRTGYLLFAEGYTMPQTTEQIDKLFLELSQFTNATTVRELKLYEELKRLRHLIQQVIWAVERGEAIEEGGELFSELDTAFNME